MKQCPQCGGEMRYQKGDYPWIAWYFVCDFCGFGCLDENPSRRKRD